MSKQNAGKIIIIVLLILIGTFYFVNAQTKKIKILDKEYSIEQYNNEIKPKVVGNFIAAFVSKNRQMTISELTEWIEVAKREIQSCKFKNITLSKENLIVNLSRFNNVILLGCEK